MKTVFYSWQSDLPNNTNRGFVRDCIDRAIRTVHADLGIDVPLRTEEGIKGVPGNVDVARTIFERIDNCAIFVPDISIVTEKNAKRPMPNPNVMIEYGRATKSCADKRVLPVFNAAFGNWETDRPFDMRHKSPPIVYELPEVHDEEQKKSARINLVKALTKEFIAIIESGLLENSPEEIESIVLVAPYQGHNSNQLPTAPLGRISRLMPTQDGDTNVWLRQGPQLFLRLIPTKATANVQPLDLRDLLARHQVRDPMNHKTSRNGAFWYARNRDGAAAFTTEIETMTDSEAFALGVTQAYSNGELWGVDTWLLDPERTERLRGADFPSIPNFTLEEGLIVALSQYLLFARDALNLQLPLRWVVGICEIDKHRLTIEDGHTGRSFNNEIVEFGMIDDYETRIHKILEPFFNKLWEEFGKRRPASANERWEQATGFDLTP